MLRIQIKDGSGHLVHQSLLAERPVTLGRDPQSTVSLTEINISRNHAIIEPQGNFHRVKDLGSTNGTWVNGKPIDSHLLQSGDIVSVGSYKIQVEEIAESGTEFKEKSETHILDSLFDYDDSPESEHTLRMTLGEGLSLLTGSEEARIIRLQQIAKELGHIETPEVLYRKILNAALQELEAERGAILVSEKEGELKSVLAMEGQEVQGEAEFSIHRGVIRTVEKEHVSVLTEDASLDHRFIDKDSSTHRVFSVMCVPLLSKGKLLGAVYLDRVHSAQPFKKTDLSFLSLLANQVAASLSNAILFQDVLVEKKRVQSICDNLYDGLVITNAKLMIDRFNVQASQLLAERGTNLTGKNFIELLSNLDPEFDHEAFHEALQEGDSFKLFFHLENRMRFYHISISSFALEGEREPGYLFSVRDSSALIDLENLKTDFIRSASHKLRTPLTVVMGNLEIMRMDVQSQPAVEAVVGESVEVMDRNLQQLQGLVDRFIEFAELDQSMEDIEELDLFDVIHMAWGGLSYLAQEKNIKFTVEGEPGQVFLFKGSSDRLVQCFSHLLDNAIKFSDEDTQIRVNLSFDRDDTLVSISDEGVGIKEENWKYIYTGFHQGEEVLTGEVPGAGLGLTIAKRILQLHQAEIQGVSPDPSTGKGTRFTIRFKARENETVKPAYLETDLIPDLVI